jgi:hypothetical protein
MPTVNYKRKNAYAALIVLSMLFIAGIAGGAVIGAVKSDNPLLSALSDSYITLRVGQDFLSRVVSSFTPAIISLFVTFLLGFDSVLFIAIPLVLVYRGLGVGTALAAIYAGMGVHGIGAAVLIVIPFAVFSGLILIIAVREAMRMSLSVLRVSASSTGKYAPVDYGLYVSKFIILSFLMLTAAFADGFLTMIFGRFIYK